MLFSYAGTKQSTPFRRLNRALCVKENGLSTAYYIELEDEVVFDTFVNGKALASAAEEIIEIAEKAGIKPIDDYLSQDLGELFDDIEVPDDNEILWFEPEEGIEYLNSIIDCIDGKAVSFDRDLVLEDLNEMVAVLSKAKDQGVKWHFELDI